jgi:hypothetical protein
VTSISFSTGINTGLHQNIKKKFISGGKQNKHITVIIKPPWRKSVQEVMKLKFHEIS